jgi:polyphenol oxidase
MIKKQFDSHQHWQFKSFNEIQSVKHLITGRNSNIPKRGVYDGLNYGLNVSDHTHVVERNRTELLKHLNVPSGTLNIPIQTHSNNIVVVTDANKHQLFEDTDALITNTPNIAIGALSADCVPILMVDPIKNVIASVHAGWRGTAAQIAANTVLKMIEQFNVLPENILIGIGPSISANCYEVGEEVASYFSKESKIQQANGKSCIDLWIANERQLLNIGLQKKNISISDLCTYSNVDQFYSARKEGIKTGRMASVISIVK